MRSQALYYPESGPFNGPFSIDSRIADTITAAPFEGLWIPCGPAKAASIEVNGTFSALTLNLIGTNNPDIPLNTYTVAVGGSATNTDVLTLTFSNPNLQGGQENVALTVTGSPTLAQIATQLAAAIVADTALAALGFTATANSTTVTITYPSVGPAAQEGPTAATPGLANTTVLTATPSGGATETLTVGLGSDGVQMSQITAVGFLFLPTPIKFVKARIAAFTGTNVIAYFRGVG